MNTSQFVLSQKCLCIDEIDLLLIFVIRSPHGQFAFQIHVRYTAASELLPLLAAGTTPLLKVDKISQTIDTNSSTIVNSTTLSNPFAYFSFSASATFEVRSPTRIQVSLGKSQIFDYFKFLFNKWSTYFTMKRKEIMDDWCNNR